MRCISCQSLSYKIICDDCQDRFLQPSFYKREIQKDFFVYSFYKFDDIKDLINTKYHFFGDRVFKILASLTFKKFGLTFNYSDQIYAIPIDDHTRHQFSHTAILAKSLKSQYITPLYDCIKATNIVKYAGKDLKFREQNPRKFIYKGPSNIQTIVVDDLVTTGTTINEAKIILNKNSVEVLFGLAISDAQI